MWIGEEKSLFSKLLLESGSVWIARECVPFSIPSFFWWEWNVKWQNPRQSPVCVSKARLIQDEFWACQAQLYQPRLTLTELKKENIKRKDWHKEIMSYESMCDLSIVNVLFWWKLYRLQAKKIMNKPAIVGELMLWTHQHTWYFWLFVSFYKITWLQRSPKHDPTSTKFSHVSLFPWACLFSFWTMSCQRNGKVRVWQWVTLFLVHRGQDHFESHCLHKPPLCNRQIPFSVGAIR